MDADTSQSFRIPQLNDGTFLLDESLPDFSLTTTPRPPLKDRTVNSTSQLAFSSQRQSKYLEIQDANRAISCHSGPLSDYIGRAEQSPQTQIVRSAQPDTCLGSAEQISIQSFHSVPPPPRSTPISEQTTPKANTVVMPESRKTRVTRTRRGKVDAASNSTSQNIELAQDIMSSFPKRDTHDGFSCPDISHPTRTAEAILFGGIHVTDNERACSRRFPSRLPPPFNAEDSGKDQSKSTFPASTSVSKSTSIPRETKVSQRERSLKEEPTDTSALMSSVGQRTNWVPDEIGKTASAKETKAAKVDLHSQNSTKEASETNGVVSKDRTLSYKLSLKKQRQERLPEQLESYPPTVSVELGEVSGITIAEENINRTITKAKMHLKGCLDCVPDSSEINASAPMRRSSQQYEYNNGKTKLINTSSGLLEASDRGPEEENSITNEQSQEAPQSVEAKLSQRRYQINSYEEDFRPPVLKRRITESTSKESTNKEPKKASLLSLKVRGSASRFRRDESIGIGNTVAEGEFSYVNSQSKSYAHEQPSPDVAVDARVMTQDVLMQECPLNVDDSLKKGAVSSPQHSLEAWSVQETESRKGAEASSPDALNSQLEENASDTKVSEDSDRSAFRRDEMIPAVGALGESCVEKGSADLKHTAQVQAQPKQSAVTISSFDSYPVEMQSISEPRFISLKSRHESRRSARKPVPRRGTTIFHQTVPVFNGPSHSVQRAAQRREFEIGRKAREEERERIKAEERRRREMEEDKHFKELRRKAVPIAHPIPDWYVSAPRRSKRDP